MSSQQCLGLEPKSSNAVECIITIPWSLVHAVSSAAYLLCAWQSAASCAALPALHHASKLVAPGAPVFPRRAASSIQRAVPTEPALQAALIRWRTPSRSRRAGSAPEPKPEPGAGCGARWRRAGGAEADGG